MKWAGMPLNICCLFVRQKVPRCLKKKKKREKARCSWLTPVILATQEAEIRKIMVQSQPGQIVHETLSRKTLHKKGLVEWLKVKALSSNSRTAKKKKRGGGKKITKTHTLQVLIFLRLKNLASFTFSSVHF
jgi:hypothetical protein